MWPFRKKAKSHPDARVWNEDWEIGDIAECIGDNWPDKAPWNPTKGERNKVSSIEEGISTCGRRCYALKFVGKPPNQGWGTKAFRKVRPLAQERADEQFVEQMRKIGRKQEVGR